MSSERRLLRARGSLTLGTGLTDLGVGCLPLFIVARLPWSSPSFLGFGWVLVVWSGLLVRRSTVVCNRSSVVVGSPGVLGSPGILNRPVSPDPTPSLAA